jgi:hypothetical protein
MATSNVVKYHLREALRASLAESEGAPILSGNLHAETKMRLISMSEDDLWELAMVTCPPEKTVEQVWSSLMERVDELRESADEWMKDLERYD